jgi:hypothetical protein
MFHKKPTALNEEVVKILTTTNIINTFSRNKIYHIHNVHGLGDSVFNMILFYNIKQYIEVNNIRIIYYAKQDYLSQLREFNCSNNIFLNSIDKAPNFSLELWINNDFFEYTHIYAVLIQNPSNYNIFYKNFFNVVLKKLNINQPIYRFMYYDDELLNRYNALPMKYKNADIMILNSTPFSGQYEYNKAVWDDYIIKLNKHFKLITTTKVHDVLCTYDDKLTIKSIASLSTKAKVVIAINSGVFPGLLNYYTLTSVKRFYIFDNRCYYSYPNFENKNHITDITVEELSRYIV